MDSYEDQVKQLQATAMTRLERDMAAAIKQNDPLYRQKHQFILNLAATRMYQKLSQAELAAKTGMQQSAIARIESGKGNPSLNTLLKLAKALNANLMLE